MLLSKYGLEIYLLLLLIVKIIFVIFVVLDLYSKYKLHNFLNSFKTSTKEIENKKKILNDDLIFDRKIRGGHDVRTYKVLFNKIKNEKYISIVSTILFNLSILLFSILS